MKLKILKNVRLKDNRFLLELSAPSSFKTAAPGQFLHLRIEDSCDPLLRRPFSIHDIASSSQRGGCLARVLYEVVGKGTEILAQKRSSAEIDSLGPLGKGFDIEKISKASQIYLVAGGMGVAPLYFLAKQLTENRGQKTEDRKPVVLLGAKTKNHILCEKEFKALGCDVHIATEDGSKGFKGLVTDLLKSLLLSTIDYRLSTICSCGPKPMLAVISEIAHQHRLAAQVSLEEFMGCGLGACLGCVIRTTSGYRRICHDGPVFEASEIIWRE